ncbi:MAG: VWA domain-containing protein [Acidobacteria bacterium]|nr:VWA domain-containing protein [Acidobacteriota bacterium]
MRNSFSWLLIGLLVTGGLLAAQSTQAPVDQPDDSPAVTFQVQIDYVEVDAIVTDADGNPVRDLGPEDFEVLEDNVPQDVQLFSFVDVPIGSPDQPRRATALIEPDVRTNFEFDGRLYVLMLDDLHTSFQRSEIVRNAAREFVEDHLAANDLAAVVHLSGLGNNGQNLTTNKRLLSEAIDKFVGRNLEGATANRLQQYRGASARPDNPEVHDIQDLLRFERAYNAESSMDGIAAVAQYVEGVRGLRKALLYFGEGLDYNVLDPFNNRAADTVINSVKDAIAAATRANAAIYTIDARGLSAEQVPIELQGRPLAERNMGLSPDDIQNEIFLAGQSMQTLSEQTGGYALVNSNDYGRAFDRIVRENSAYYVLGYYPTDAGRDDRFRTIDVRVTRPGVQVRARRGYVPPDGSATLPADDALGETSARLRNALYSPVPDKGLGMAMSAAAFKGEGGNASVLVTVRIDGDRFSFGERDGLLTDSLELSVMAVDPAGNVQHGSRQALDMTLRPETAEVVQAAGFRLQARLSLEPGRYQLRAGVLTRGTDSVGTVHADLEVPDFSREPFSMSDILISSDFTAMIPAASFDEQVKAVLPTPQTTGRTFATADTIRVFTEVYDNQPQPQHEVEITTTLRVAGGRVVSALSDQRSSTELQGAQGGYGHVAEIPLRNVAPGEYVLRVETASRLAASMPVAREVLIRVSSPPGIQTEASPLAAPAARSFVDVANGAQSRVTDTRGVVARDEAELRGLWSSLGLERAMPMVTFDNTMVVAVFLGSRPAPGYRAEIVGVRRDGDTMVVEWVERLPGGNAAAAEGTTTPYVIAGVPAFAGQVQFAKLAAVPE